MQELCTNFSCTVIQISYLMLTAFRVSSSMCIKKFTAADSLDTGYVANVPSSDVFVQFPFHSDVSHCSRTLTGYWIGPDTDDGWGFVEAVLDDTV